MVIRNSINNDSDTFTTTTLTATAIKASSISFDGGTTNMSNYSVTTFTPSLSIGGSTTGITYSSRSGTLIRVGRLATVIISIVLSSKGSNSGDLKIAFGITTNSSAATFFGFDGEAITLPADGQSLIGEILTNDIFLYYSSNGGSKAPMDNTQIGNPTAFYFNFSFLTT